MSIDELSRKQKSVLEKVELAQTTECKAFNKKLRVEQVPDSVSLDLPRVNRVFPRLIFEFEMCTWLTWVLETP